MKLFDKVGLFLFRHSTPLLIITIINLAMTAYWVGRSDGIRWATTLLGEGAKP